MSGNYEGIKKQCFGVEIECTGLTRATAAKAISRVLGYPHEYFGGSYDKYYIRDEKDRKWSVVYDSSIKRVDKNGNAAPKNYAVEIVTPVLEYEDMSLLQEVVRAVKKAGGITGAEYRAGIHIHIDGTPYTAQSLRNLVNIFASKENFMFDMLQVSPFRETYAYEGYPKYYRKENVSLELNELSSWKHLSDEKSVVYGLPNNKKSDIIVKSYGYVCKGGGSAFGGGWKPKSTADERLVGEPGEIKTSFLGGYSRETLIGDNGYAIKERHYTTAPNPKYHTNPHDHTITWENNYPCFGEADNYWSGDVPALKYHIKIGDSFNMTNHFESLSEIKFSILYGGELIFRNNNRTYGITRLNKERIVLAEINGKNEVSFESLDKLLEFEIDGRKMSDILKTAEIIDRNI